jgi:hypothetical protein
MFIILYFVEHIQVFFYRAIVDILNWKVAKIMYFVHDVTNTNWFTDVFWYS